MEDELFLNVSQISSVGSVETRKGRKLFLKFWTHVQHYVAENFLKLNVIRRNTGRIIKKKKNKKLQDYLEGIFLAK